MVTFVAGFTPLNYHKNMGNTQYGDINDTTVPSALLSPPLPSSPTCHLIHAKTTIQTQILQ